MQHNKLIFSLKYFAKVFLVFMLMLVVIPSAKAQKRDTIRNAPAPMYNDPIYDGAADPVMVWNHEEKQWWMLYTTRRANMPTVDVSAYYGNKIGVASTADQGATWIFRGYLDLEFERGWNTFWAPDVVYDHGTYHMYVSYIKGARNHWGGASTIHHFTSKNLWDWKHEEPLVLSSDQVIDPTLFKMKNGNWRIWYKDGKLGGLTMMSESSDLKNWKTLDKPTIGGGAHEGPKVFNFKGYYWMLTDEWHGLRVYRSHDLNHWEKQGLILDAASDRPLDKPTGAHADVLAFKDKAFVFYFTHPGRDKHTELKPGNSFYENHRTSIQVAPLIFKDGTLKAPRDKPFDFVLPNGDY